eukprot:3757670-Alexandrium_andersonii.AAC.1
MTHVAVDCPGHPLQSNALNTDAKTCLGSNRCATQALAVNADSWPTDCLHCARQAGCRNAPWAR